MSVDGSGNAYVTGVAGDMFLAKYDTNGKKLWTRQLGTRRRDGGNGISVDGDGNAYVTGYTEGDLDGSYNAGGMDLFLPSVNSNGKKLWTSQFGTGEDESGYGVSVDGNGNVYVTGSTDNKPRF